jgi:GST-like protein
MAIYPWIVPYEAMGQNLDDFPHVKRWFDAVAARPATVTAYAKGEGIRDATKPMSDEERKILFGQTAASTATG